MIKITTWHPDTCDCTIHYAWDTETTEDERVHTPVERDGVASTVDVNGRTAIAPKLPTKRCKVHKHLMHHVKHHDTVLEENQRKNISIGHIVESDQTIAHSDVSWHFDEARILHLICPKLNASQRSALQAKTDIKFGQNKVIHH